MAAFPTIEPIGRSYNLGANPVSEFTANNGDACTFIHDVTHHGVTLLLQFRALSLTDAEAIDNHYLGQRGRSVPFTIPSALWRTHASTTDVVPAGRLWRYTGPPTRARRMGNLFDVAVSLLAE